MPRAHPTPTTPPPRGCVRPDPAFIPDLSVSIDQGSDVVSAKVVRNLNSGATYEAIITNFPKSPGTLPYLRHLTGDNTNELVLTLYSDTLVIGCLDGEYRLLLDNASEGGAPDLEFVGDMNSDGIPEVIFTDQVTSAWNTEVDILEWNGESFLRLIEACHGYHALETSTLAKALYWYEDDWLPRDPGYCIDIPMMNGSAQFQVATRWQRNA
jgi:hypothetical protein